MKKTFSRLLSLLLVLVMLMSVLPMAMAEKGELPDDREEEDSGVVTPDPDPDPEEPGGDNITGELPDDRDEPDDGKDDDDDDDNAVVATAIRINGTGTMSCGTNQVLTAYAVSPTGAKVPSDLKWTSSSTAVTISGSGAKVTISANRMTDGAISITASSASAGISASFAVTVTKRVVDFVPDKSSFTLNPNESAQVTGAYAPQGIGSYVTLSFSGGKSSNGTTVVDVGARDGMLYARAAGTATVTITMTLSNAGYETMCFAGGLQTTTKTVTVTVLDKCYISCDNRSVAVGSTATLTPILYDGNGKQIETATFTAAVSGNASISPSGTAAKSFDLTSNSAGYAAVTFTAVGMKDDNNKAITKTVYVGFYTNSSVKVTVADNVSSFKFSDKNIAKEVYIGTKSFQTVGYGMVDFIGTAIGTVTGANYCEFSIGTSAGGDLVAPVGSNWTTSTKEVGIGDLDDVGFTQKSSTDPTTTFTVTVRNATASSASAVIVAQVSVEVVCGASAAIEYKTTTGQAVTFNGADFQNFWNNQNKTTSSSLTYVKFGVSNTVPLYGKLYVDSTRAATVGSSDTYAVSASGSYKSLSKVTFVADATKTGEYDVQIPFTAYGSAGNNVTGYVVIKHNTTGNVIDCRGINLSKLVESIAANYKTQKNQDMERVTFSTLDVKKATLYRSIPYVNGANRVAMATAVKLDDVFYYRPNSTYSATEMKLADVTIIPAADFIGTLTVNYTATNAGNSMPYEGTLTFTVQARTSSVFTDMKNHAWAIDSADFLYYDGIAQGSDGKYNPSANITRRDFMLMLYRAFLADKYGSETVTSNFPDVIKGTDDYSKEIYQAVGIAKKLGIAQGTNDKFNPTAYITRQEAMVLIHRTLNTMDRTLRYKSGISATSFKDYSKIGSWATDAIKALVSSGVIVGTDDMVKPQSNITRAEMAKILHRVITY